MSIQIILYICVQIFCAFELVCLGLTDEQLMEITTKDLNALLKTKTLTRKQRDDIKHKRRTLKNRNYAASGLTLMAYESNQLNNERHNLDEEVNVEFNNDILIINDAILGKRTFEKN